MPKIIAYSDVLESMRGWGLKSLYHNSGAFGFTDASNLHHLGWIGPPDSTLRSTVLQLTRQIPAPYESNLTIKLVQLWRQTLPGPLWLLPMSHWAYELDVNDDWLARALKSININPDQLKNRNTGDALEFTAAESDLFAPLCQVLLEHLKTSDYLLAFPTRPVLCTLHHHKQLWWSTTDASIYEAVDHT